MAYTLKTPSIILSPSVKDFLSRFERNLDFDFVVTSGTRTPAQQVSAMFYKVGQGEDLKAVYADDTFADLVQNAYPDTEKAIAIVEDYAAQGKGSSHLRGLGVDIRTRDLSTAQLNVLIDVAKQLGAPVAIYEPVPPHVHITVPKKKLNLAKFGILVLIVRGIFWLNS